MENRTISKNSTNLYTHHQDTTRSQRWELQGTIFALRTRVHFIEHCPRFSRNLPRKIRNTSKDNLIHQIQFLQPGEIIMT